MIVGVDPGKDTGVAIFKDKKLVELKTFTPFTFILWLQENKKEILTNKGFFFHLDKRDNKYYSF